MSSTDSKPNAPLSQLLQPLRDEIDAIDQQLLTLLNTRMEYVKQVGVIKESMGLASFIRPERENTMLHNISTQQADKAFPAHAAAQIWRLIITASLDTEKKLRIGIVGNTSDLRLLVLARDYFGAFVSMKLYESVDIVMNALLTDNVDIAITPPISKDECIKYESQHLKVFIELPVKPLDRVPEPVSDCTAFAVAKFLNG